MRTAIFLGLIFVAKAICYDIVSDTTNVIAPILAILFMMDLVLFYKKVSK